MGVGFNLLGSQCPVSLRAWGYEKSCMWHEEVALGKFFPRAVLGAWLGVWVAIRITRSRLFGVDVSGLKGGLISQSFSTCNKKKKRGGAEELLLG